MVKEVITFNLCPAIFVRKVELYSELWNLMLDKAIEYNCSKIEIGADGISAFGVILDGISLTTPITIYISDNKPIIMEFNPSCYRKILFDGELAFDLVWERAMTNIEYVYNGEVEDNE